MRLNTIDFKVDRRSTKKVHQDLQHLEGDMYYRELPKRFGEKLYELYLYYPEIELGTSLGTLVRDLKFLVPEIFKQGIDGYKVWMAGRMKNEKNVLLTQVELLNEIDGKQGKRLLRYYKKYQKKVELQMQERA